MCCRRGGIIGHDGFENEERDNWRMIETRFALNLNEMDRYVFSWGPRLVSCSKDVGGKIWKVSYVRYRFP